MASKRQEKGFFSDISRNRELFYFIW